MKATELAPIVLFTYNRPWHTQQTIEALQKNQLANESELFIYSDAPKNNDDVENVKSVRKYIKTINGFKKVNIKERSKNWGLANSIIDGVTKVVNEYGHVIVLEDDLITSPHFLDFMNKNLSLYRNNEIVGSITGYIPYIEDLPDLFFLKFGASLGWGTWKRVWNSIEFDSDKLLLSFDNKKKIKEFNMDGAYNYYQMLNYQNDKKIDSWAIRFVASQFLQNFIHLRVGKSLVQHIGSDSGTHCNTDTRSNEEDGIISYVPIQDKNFKINVIEDIESYKLFKKFYKKNILTRIINKLNRILKEKK